MTYPSLAEAYGYCRTIAQGHYENFPVGSLLIPRPLRKHFFALYAFMRTADDFADLSNRSSEERLKLLGDWRAKLHSIFQKEQPIDSIFIALQDTIQKCDLAIEPFDLLLDAFEFDARGNVTFEMYDDLHWYTTRSAEPVGQLVLTLFGYRDDERIGWSNDICTALQLINFMQDVKDDLAVNRCYFPLEDCRAFGIGSVDELQNSSQTARLMLYECDRVQSLLEKGKALAESVDGRLKRELRAIMEGARLMLAKIRSMNGDTINNQPKLSRFEQWHILVSALRHSL